MEQVLGFGEYIEEVYAAYEQHKLDTLVCAFKLQLCYHVANIPLHLHIYMLLEIFLFILLQQDSPKGGKFSGIEMTEEEALAEQQRMFAEARARMNQWNDSTEAIRP